MEFAEWRILYQPAKVFRRILDGLPGWPMTLKRAALTMVLMPVFFSATFRNWPHPLHVFSQAAGWGAIILLFFSFYLLLFKVAERLDWAQWRPLSVRGYIFFAGFTIQELYWLSMAVLFTGGNMSGLLSYTGGVAVVFTTLVLLLPVLIWNYFITYRTFKVQTRLKRHAHLLFWLYMLLSLGSAALHGYIMEYHYAIGLVKGP